METPTKAGNIYILSDIEKATEKFAKSSKKELYKCL